METLVQQLKAATKQKRDLEWVLIRKWTLLMNAATRAEDPDFKRIFRKHADDLVKMSNVTIH